MSRLALPTRKKRTQVAWGIDVGESSLKAVRVSRGTDDELTIECCALIRYDHSIVRPEEIGEKNDLIAMAARQLVERYEVRKDAALCVSLMGKETLGKLLRFPATSPKKLAEIIRNEVPQQIPYPLEDLAWAYYVMPAEDPVSDVSHRDVVLLAAKQVEARGRLRVFEDLDLRVDVLQCDCVALHNFARFEQLDKDPRLVEQGNPPLALVDVGARTTNVVLSGEGLLWFRTVPVGGDDFTAEVVRRFKLTRKQAEELKNDPLRARWLSQMYDALDPISARCTSELQRSFNAFVKDFPERASFRVLGIGGGFQLHGLLRYLLRGPSMPFIEHEER